MDEESVSAETDGITVSVRTEYQAVYSNPRQGSHVFAYHVTIINRNIYPVRLLRRHWFIFDSIGESYEVEGEGVVGETPILEFNDRHDYTSGCNFKSRSGKMSGTYLMKRLDNGDEFKIAIPEFHMNVPDVFE